MQFPKLYFAHPITDYGTATEAVWLQYLEQHPKTNIYSIINPGDEMYQRAIVAISDGKRRMQYCLDLVDTCQALAFVSFPAWINSETPIGAGVWQEIERAHSDGKNIFWLQGGRAGHSCTLVQITDLTRIQRLRLSVAETQIYLDKIRRSRRH